MQIDLEQLVLLPIFSGIRPENLSPMLQCLGSFHKQYHKNEIIFLESQEVKLVGVVLSGVVHMVKEDVDGGKTLLVCSKEGDLFGETFACGNLINSYVSFKAVTPCSILFLPFYKVIHSCKMTCTFHHRLIENMVGLISDKNIQLMSKIEVISKKSLRDKILTYLYLQAEQQKARHFTIPLGRLELADYLCADRSALTRELTLMERDGIIRYEKNTVELL